jgi:hypothetical protein
MADSEHKETKEQPGAPSEETTAPTLERRQSKRNIPKKSYVFKDEDEEATDDADEDDQPKRKVRKQSSKSKGSPAGKGGKTSKHSGSKVPAAKFDGAPP